MQFVAVIEMDSRLLCILLFAAIPVCRSWHTLSDRRDREMRKLHYHTKRHMQTAEYEPKRKSSTQKPRELRKKPSGHLTPLDEDDIENDEFVSVAVGPPPIRIKSNKHYRKPIPRPVHTVSNTTHNSAVNLVRDVLTLLGKELLTRQLSEDFIFGQYVGNCMQNLTSELRVKMQHEILNIIVKYQKMNTGEDNKTDENVTNPTNTKPRAANETDENWPDFTNLAKIVGQRVFENAE